MWLRYLPVFRCTPPEPQLSRGLRKHWPFPFTESKRGIGSRAWPHSKQGISPPRVVWAGPLPRSQCIPEAFIMSSPRTLGFLHQNQIPVMIIKLVLSSLKEKVDKLYSVNQTSTVYPIISVLWFSLENDCIIKCILWHTRWMVNQDSNPGRLAVRRWALSTSPRRLSVAC